MLDCVAFILVAGDRILAEKRMLTENLAPGAVAIPGGHLEGGESIEGALHRELREELGVAPVRFAFICTLLHRAEELRRLHYFVVEAWEGDIANNEAEALLWVPLGDLQALDFEVDRTAVREYVRLYRGEEGLARV